MQYRVKPHTIRHSAKPPIVRFNNNFSYDGGAMYRTVHGGEGGIRTLGPLAGTTVFKTDAFDHSATSPLGY